MNGFSQFSVCGAGSDLYVARAVANRGDDCLETKPAARAEAEALAKRLNDGERDGIELRAFSGY